MSSRNWGIWVNLVKWSRYLRVRGEGVWEDLVRRQSTKWECFEGPVRSKAQSEGASKAWSEGKVQSEGGSNTTSYRRKLAPFIFIIGIVWPHNIIFFFRSNLTQLKGDYLSRVFFIICCVMTKFTQIPQLLERYSCSEISFVTRWAMTKFTQIPQLLERYPCSEISLPVG